MLQLVSLLLVLVMVVLMLISSLLSQVMVVVLLIYWVAISHGFLLNQATNLWYFPASTSSSA